MSNRWKKAAQVRSDLPSDKFRPVKGFDSYSEFNSVFRGSCGSARRRGTIFLTYLFSKSYAARPFRYNFRLPDTGRLVPQLFQVKAVVKREESAYSFSNSAIPGSPDSALIFGENTGKASLF
ncbi:MAG: hypothetical protein V1794_00860 [Candidatus Glassbacteria bacterium]